MLKWSRSKLSEEYYRDGVLNIYAGEFIWSDLLNILPALAPVAATHTGLKQIPVMSE
jgi:hypothetical protein